jgi:predicted RNA-binding Zn-ribbon protein involved in translation (DUF1610 family)
MPAQPILQSPGLLRRLVGLLRRPVGLHRGLACPKCSTPMVLRQINPDKPGFDSRIFACPRCGQQKTKVFKIR